MQHRRSTLRPRRQPLKEANDVVGRVPDEAAGERDSGDFRLGLWRTPQCLAQPVQQLRAVGRHGQPLAADLEAVPVQADFERLAQADE